MIRGGRRAHVVVKTHKTNVGTGGKPPFWVLGESAEAPYCQEKKKRKKLEKSGKTKVKHLSPLNIRSKMFHC